MSLPERASLGFVKGATVWALVGLTSYGPEYKGKVGFEQRQDIMPGTEGAIDSIDTWICVTWEDDSVGAYPHRFLTTSKEYLAARMLAG